MLAQAAVPFLRALVGGEEGGMHLLAFQHVRHQWGHRHVAGVEGQVDRFFAVILGIRAQRTSAHSYEK